MASQLIKWLDIKWEPGTDSAPQIKQIKKDIEEKSDKADFCIFCITSMYGYRAGVLGKALSRASFYSNKTYVLQSLCFTSSPLSDLERVAWGISKVNRAIPLLNIGIFDPKTMIAPTNWHVSNVSNTSAMNLCSAILDSGCALLSNTTPLAAGFEDWETEVTSRKRQGVTWGLYANGENNIMVLHANMSDGLNVQDKVLQLCTLVPQNEEAWVFIAIDSSKLDVTYLEDIGLVKQSFDAENIPCGVGVLYRRFRNAINTENTIHSPEDKLVQISITDDKEATYNGEEPVILEEYFQPGVGWTIV